LGDISEDSFVSALGFSRDDAAKLTREVQALLAPPPLSEVVSISEIVPSIFIDLAKETHSSSMKFISSAAGLIATPTVTIVLNAALSAALFSIRSAGDAVASRICCTLIKMLHTGGPPSPKQKDKDERHSWTQNFILACTMSVDKELCAANYHQAALNIANQCLQVVEDSIGRENIVYSILHMNTSKHLANLQRWDEAQATYKESVRLMDKTVAAAGSDPKEILPSVADMYKKNVPPEEAEAMFLETIRVVEQKSGRHSMEAFAPLKGLALLYEEQNRLEEAEAMLKESIQIKIIIAGPDAMDVASLMQTLSSLCIKRNKPSEAEAALKESVRILELKRGHDSEAVARALNSLGSLYQNHGLFDEAEAQFKEALRIYEMKVGHASIDVSTTLGLIGNLYAQKPLPL
jgi:tetratricopeptide (TPR) repeat protein